MRIKFLGTAGARFVVARQLRASGGLLVEEGKTSIIVDPGPGAIVRMARSRPKIDPERLSGIILTHLHLDHSNDVNIVADAMTGGGFSKKGILFAPYDALYSEERVVLKHTLSILEKVVVLEERKAYTAGSITFETSRMHDHGVETYGIKFHAEGGKIGLITDTYPFQGIEDEYGDCKYLILNVVLFKRPEGYHIKHLSLEDAERIVKAIRPDLAVITHFGMTMLKERPWKMEKDIKKKWGIDVRFARDGMTLEFP